jgi:hypothetical protein
VTVLTTGSGKSSLGCLPRLPIGELCHSFIPVIIVCLTVVNGGVSTKAGHDVPSPNGGVTSLQSFLVGVITGKAVACTPSGNLPRDRLGFLLSDTRYGHSSCTFEFK